MQLELTLTLYNLRPQICKEWMTVSRPAPACLLCCMLVLASHRQMCDYTMHIEVSVGCG